MKPRTLLSLPSLKGNIIGLQFTWWVGKGKVPEEESLFHMYFLELCHLRALAFYAVDLGIGSRFISENPPEILLHLDSCSQEGYAV